MSLQQRVQREEWVLPTDGLDFGPPTCTVVSIKYLLLVSHSQVCISLRHPTYKKNSRSRKDSSPLANWKPAALHSLAYSRLRHRTWDQMVPARTTARDSQIPGRETPGQVWVRALFLPPPLSGLKDLSMWLKVTWNPMLFTCLDLMIIRFQFLKCRDYRCTPPLLTWGNLLDWHNSNGNKVRDNLLVWSSR